MIYEKPWTVIRPEYVWRRTEAWIDFPWSAAPPLVQRAKPGRDRRRDQVRVVVHDRGRDLVRRRTPGGVVGGRRPSYLRERARRAGAARPVRRGQGVRGRPRRTADRAGDDPRRPARRAAVAAHRAHPPVVGRRGRADGRAASRRATARDRRDEPDPDVGRRGQRSLGRFRPGLPDRATIPTTRCSARTRPRSASTTRSPRSGAGAGSVPRVLWAWMLRTRHRFPDATTYFAAPDHRNAASLRMLAKTGLHRRAVVRRAPGGRHGRHGRRLLPRRGPGAGLSAADDRP